MEPVTTTAGASISVGLSAFLIGWLGQVGADVMMIILSAIAGCSIALTGQTKRNSESLIFILKGVLLALVLAWSSSELLVTQISSIKSPYLPSVVAFALGFCVDKLSFVLNRLIDSRIKKIEES